MDVARLARETTADRVPRAVEYGLDLGFDADGGEGSGLGLPIALEVAELHGGALNLGEPPGGRGLEVTVMLPLARPDAAGSASPEG